jgi:hypothetical protein
VAVPLEQTQLKGGHIMSKYSYAFLLAISLCTVNGAFADETSTTTTRTDNPDYSSTTNSTTIEDKPAYVKSETTKAETTPYGQEITHKKSYKKVPGAQKTVRTDTETTTNP